MTAPGVLCFFCGRAGAGKSTLAREMSTARRAILICEDQWLVRLFDGADIGSTQNSANIQVASNERRAMQEGREPANNNEVDLSVAQTLD